MSMKQEIETWVSALQLYDNNEFEEAIRTFGPIADTSKILFNCGVIRATLGEHEAAIEFYRKSTALDQYLAIAYFQSGVSHFLLGEFEEALRMFNDTLLYLRGNTHIDYEQLGLKFKLYSCEVLFNRGLSYIYLQATDTGMTDLQYAAKEKAIPEHDVIDEAITEKAEGYTVFSIPVGVVFRPSDAKIKNVRTRDYLGKPTIVAAARSQQHNPHPSSLSSDIWAKDDRPANQISYAATNLVRPGLSVRTRQQSEPPISRNLYPPTPPPDAEKPANLRSLGSETGYRKAKAASPPRARSRSTSRRPEPLELGTAAFEPQAKEQSRRMPARSASERPKERRRMDSEYQPSIQAGDLPMRSKPTRERLFGALDNELPNHDRSTSNERTSSKSNGYPRMTSKQSRPQHIEEEDDEYRVDESTELPTVRSSVATNNSTLSYRRGSSRTTTTLKKVRVKVHLDEDTRYILIMPDISYAELTEIVVRKFQLDVHGIKLKLKDEEGDMITMSDQADLDMFMTMSKDQAAKAGTEIGKLELWIQC